MGVRLVVVFALVASASGCDKLFSLTHVANRDAGVDAPPCAPLSVATGRSHTCSVDYQGRVYCWGRNEWGQAQPHGPMHVLQPMRIVLPLPAVQVTAGKRYSCARLEDGAVWCWGQGDIGQLGSGTNDVGPGPVAIAGIPPSAEVRAGGATVCSRSADDGTVWCWGGNRFRASGQVTDVQCPGKESCVTPGPVPTTAGSKALVVGHRHACVIGQDDRLRCWGRDSSSQLGDDGAAGDQRTMPLDIPQLGTVVAAAAGPRQTCAIDSGGAMQCWGEGYDYQLATGRIDNVGTPTSSLIEDARSVVLGQSGGCSLLGDGTVSCWGEFDAGDGSAGVEMTPVTANLDGVVDLASGFLHSCAIARGDIYCWGFDSDGQLGRGTRTVSETPIEVIPSGATFIAAGEGNACAKTSAGVACWGTNSHGEVGAADLQSRYEPYAVTGFNAVEGLVSAFDRTCAWGNGDAKCWGRGNSGSLGNGENGRAFATPQTVLADDIAQVAIGGDHLCVRQTTGTVTCFGYNGKGQLGTPPTTTLSMDGVTLAFVGDPAMKITAGRAHTCALTSAPDVYCWGNNTYGQLGDGTKVDRSTPTKVPGLGTIVDIQAGNFETCARDMSGSVWCWGINSNGQIGDGTRTASTTPVKTMLPAGRTATELAVGGDHACAILDDQTVACWGDGDDGALGTGTSEDQSLPVVVPGFANARRLALGRSATCALFDGGQVKCAGDNRYLANGDSSRSVPALTVRGACEN